MYIPLSSNLTLVNTSDRQSNDSTNIIIKDYLSSTRMIINDDGKVLNTISYYPYGAVNQQYNNLAIEQLNADKLFTGHRKLDNLNIYHAGARFYSPTLGLFIQPDSVQGPNRYTYVSGNPISLSDPTGNMEVNEGMEAPFFMDYQSARDRLRKLWMKVARQKISEYQAEQILDIYAQTNYNYQTSQASRLKGENGITGKDILEAKTEQQVIELIRQANPTIKIFQTDLILIGELLGSYLPEDNILLYIPSINDYEQLITLKHEAIHSLSFNQLVAQQLLLDPKTTRRDVLKMRLEPESIFNEEAMTYGSTILPGYIQEKWQNKNLLKNADLIENLSRIGYWGLVGAIQDYQRRNPGYILPLN